MSCQARGNWAWYFYHDKDKLQTVKITLRWSSSLVSQCVKPCCLQVSHSFQSEGPSPSVWDVDGQLHRGGVWRKHQPRQELRHGLANLQLCGQLQVHTFTHRAAPGKWNILCKIILIWSIPLHFLLYNSIQYLCSHCLTVVNAEHAICISKMPIWVTPVHFYKSTLCSEAVMHAIDGN